MPITVTARSKAWAVFARSNTGIVDSNPTQGVYSVFVLFCALVVAFRRADPPSKESYRLYKKGRETEKAAKVQQRAVEP
jgi:hypothetical protein